MFGNNKSILQLFLKQIVMILIAFAFFTLSYLSILEIGIMKGIFVSANEPALLMEEYSNKITSGESIQELELSDSVDYVVLNNLDNEILKTNMKEQTLQKYIQDDRIFEENFLQATDNSGTLLIYSNLKAQFSDLNLRHTFPNVEILTLVVMILLFLLVVFLIAKKFQHILKLENNQLIKITDQIEKEDLNIVLPDHKIKEYQPVYKALERLASELKQSILKNIELQQEKEKQISFLVHDLKTPLTIIKGNVELLTKDILNEENFESFEDIRSSIEECEKYIQQIIDFNFNSSLFVNESVQKINVKDISEKIANSGLIPKYRVDFRETNMSNKKVIIHENEFLRAVSNILMNAIERTPEEKKVVLSIEINKRLILTIEDFGNGFSEDALEKAKTLFYTENAARVSNQHYGLGLTFSSKIIESFGGSIKLSNTNSGSGRVTIFLPLSE